MDFVTDQSAAEINGVRLRVAALALMELERVNVERALALALELRVIEDDAFPGDDFGHGIGEVNGFIESKERLNDARLAIVFGNDQRARVRRRDVIIGGRNEHEIDGLLDDLIFRQEDERPILDRKSTRLNSSH